MTAGKATDSGGEFEYGGHRILEAMRSAPRYGDAVYAFAKSACGSLSAPILEFGAGEGAFVERFLRDGTAVDCVEPDPLNQEALRLLGVRVVSDLSEIANGQYEFVYAINVLEHLTELDHYLAELNRVLRPSGRLFVFVPAFTILWTSLDDEVGHLRRFTLRSLTDCVKRAGFEIDASHYFDSLGFFAASAVRLLEKVGLFEYSPATVGFYDRVFLPVSMTCDRALSTILGKNVIAVASKPCWTDAGF
jgi:SAM-dependent methyltransferase